MLSEHTPQQTNENTTPSRLEEGQVAKIAFKDAPEAYKAVMRDLLNTLSRNYEPPMSFTRALIDAVCENGKFSPKKAAILAASTGMGATVASFYYATATTAASDIVTIIYNETGISLPASDILTYFMQAASCSENGAVSVFSMVKMFDHFFTKESEAHKFLKPKLDKLQDKIKGQSLNLFELCCAIASNVPTYLITQSSLGTPLALLTAASGISASWMGVHNMKLGPDKRHPACALESAYLGEQIDAFLNLTFEEQNIILDKIMQRDANGANDDDHYRQMYARVLRLSEVDLNKEIKTHEAPETTLATKATCVGMATIGVFSTSAYRFETYTGVTGLFSNPTSPQAILAALPAVLLSLLPGIGFAVNGGIEAGTEFTRKNKALASLYAPRARKALEVLIGILSAFSGSATFTLAYDDANTFNDLAGIAGPLRDFLTLFYTATGTTSTSILNGYYTSKLLDEILIYFALRCGDEKVKRLFTFVLEARKLQGTLNTMSNENYLEILKWKLEIDHYSNLSTLMKGLLEDRLSDKKHKITQDDLRKLGYNLRDQATKVEPLADPFCCGLFHRKVKTNPQTTDKVELQFKGYAAYD